MRKMHPEEIQPPASPSPGSAARPGPGLVAARLIARLSASESDLVYVALGETSAAGVAEAIRALDAGANLLMLSPWDCLPYDRVSPTRHCMGRRMDTLRSWLEPAKHPRLLVTSLDAMLQRVPPSDVIRQSRYRLVVGKRFDRSAFEDFTRRTGYSEEAIVDDPGEFAVRDDLIDIYPAGAGGPMRIVVDDKGMLSELRAYDPATQRTTELVEEIVLGPASEALVKQGCDAGPDARRIDDQLLELYPSLDTVFDAIGSAPIVFSQGVTERLEAYLDIIDEARIAREEFDKAKVSRSLYLDRTEWGTGMKGLNVVHLQQEAAPAPPRFSKQADPRGAFLDYVKSQVAADRRVVITGHGPRFRGLCRRLEAGLQIKTRTAGGWQEIVAAEPGSILTYASDLADGFAEAELNLTAIPAAYVLGEAATPVADNTILAEPELRPGDVVVHEDHGVSILRGIETVVTDGVECDVAQLEYHGGAMLLVPMHDFGKLWRYGSQADKVNLDRLHTEGWQKKRATIARDIRTIARHMMRLAKQRRETQAATIVPPRAEYARFIAHFPHAETPDQLSAVEAVLADLSSGRVMDRLVCGDVGFGKTEVALRAAAAVALSGGQVAVVAPTTVLARQHFSVFKRRFAGTGVKVAMLSRVVPPAEVKRIKAELANAGVGIVVATHAILAKDVSFAQLQLLVIDEEQRFGARDKAKMQALAPALHTLVMSATPIPRTLQAAMVGLREVSLLSTAPSRRRPVRTSLTDFDRGSARIALLREHRRGGQSFFVAPQIEDLDALQVMIADIVPELSVRVAHGRLPAVEMDEIMVGFAEGDGDILLSTNIVESGLDVPQANTMFIWRADRFGLAQLHQLRGRVGRGRAQGNVYMLLDAAEDVSEQTRQRLAALVELDRLGAGLSISLEDLDMRGGGDIAGESQAGHMKVIGISLYQRLLARGVRALRKEPADENGAVAVNLGIVGSIPADYVGDAAIRLNLYARLLRVSSPREIDDMAEEFEDRFGDVPEAVLILLRLARLRIAAASLGISKMDAGPRAMAVSFAAKPTRKILAGLSKRHDPVVRDGRLIFEIPSSDGSQRLAFFEELLGL